MPETVTKRRQSNGRRWRFISFAANRKEGWPSSLDWIMRPGVLSGAASVADVFGQLPPYEPSRFHWTADHAMLARDFKVIAENFNKALGLTISETNLNQARLFDPDTLDVLIEPES